MTYVLLLIVFIIVLYIIQYSVKSENSVKLIFLFALFAFIYYLGLPTEMILKNTSVGLYGYFSDRAMMIIISMGILSIVGFTLGFESTKYKIADADNIKFKNNKILFSTAMFLSILSGLVLFVFYRSTLISSGSSYFGNVTVTYNNPVYAYLKEVFTSSIAILTLWLTISNKRNLVIAFVLTILLIIFGIVTSDKDPVLLAVLSWGWFFFILLKKVKLQKMYVYVSIFFVSIILVPALSLLFSLNRSSSISQYTNQVEKVGIYKTFDASGPLVSLVEILEDPNVKFEYGRTYYWGFISWIPKSIWHNRPIDLSESYAKEKVSNWKPGEGLGYSLLTEAYKNFGVSGAIIQYFFIGLFIGLIGKFHQWLFKEQIAPMLFFIWASYNIAIMHRGPFNLPSSYIRFILPYLIIYYSLYSFVTIYSKWKIRKGKQLV